MFHRPHMFCLPSSLSENHRCPQHPGRTCLTNQNQRHELSPEMRRAESRKQISDVTRMYALRRARPAHNFNITRMYVISRRWGNKLVTSQGCTLSGLWDCAHLNSRAVKEINQWRHKDLGGVQVPRTIELSRKWRVKWQLWALKNIIYELWYYNNIDKPSAWQRCFPSL